MDRSDRADQRAVVTTQGRRRRKLDHHLDHHVRHGSRCYYVSNDRIRRDSITYRPVVSPLIYRYGTVAIADTAADTGTQYPVTACRLTSHGLAIVLPHGK